MLPRIDTNGGRGNSRRDVLTSRIGAEEKAVVPLPRLRLLKQVGGGESPVVAPPPLEKMAAPPRRLLLSRGKSGGYDKHRDGSDSLQPVQRGRGLLRPVDDRGQALLSQPPRSRSPPPMPRSEHELLQEDVSALLQQRARVRVKEQRRHKRRVAREEEERRQQDEQERMERVKNSEKQIEAHRRELARQAAERHRRSREDREDRAHEREELQSDRRERMRRYQTPAQIQALKNNHRSGSPGCSPGSHVEAEPDDKNNDMPRRAARAPSAEVQKVRERRRGSRGRAPDRDDRKSGAADLEQPVENAANLEESTAVMTPSREQAKTLLEYPAEAVSASIDDIAAVLATFSADVRRKLVEALSGEASKAKTLLEYPAEAVSASSDDIAAVLATFSADVQRKLLEALSG